MELWIDAPGPAALRRGRRHHPRTGERSPECRSCSWLPGRPPGTVGARFRGRNRTHHMRWSRVCEVTAADPGANFTFHTVSDRLNPLYHDSTTWSYTFSAEGDGTRGSCTTYRIDVWPYRPLGRLYACVRRRSASRFCRICGRMSRCCGWTCA